MGKQEFEGIRIAPETREGPDENQSRNRYQGLMDLFRRPAALVLHFPDLDETHVFEGRLHKEEAEPALEYYI